MTEYKLATYQSEDGPRAALIVGEFIHDVAAVTGKATYSSVRGILDDWPNAHKRIETAAASLDSKGSSYRDAKLLTPVQWPGTIYCAGANYRDHEAEMRKLSDLPPQGDPHDLGLKPWFFIKASRTVVGPEATVRISDYSEKMDWEAELAVIIGRTARNVSIEDALDYVAGYAVGNDLSARDFSVRPQLPLSNPFAWDWLRHKSFDGSCPLGPWIVPAAYIGDPADLSIKLWVNDVLKQDSNSRNMIFNIPEQISHISSGMTLHPGDVIMTGTPAGVGHARGEYLKAGDVVRVEIDRIGSITHRMG